MLATNKGITIKSDSGTSKYLVENTEFISLIFEGPPN